MAVSLDLQETMAQKFGRQRGINIKYMRAIPLRYVICNYAFKLFIINKLLLIFPEDEW